MHESLESLIFQNNLSKYKGLLYRFGGYIESLITIYWYNIILFTPSFSNIIACYLCSKFDWEMLNGLTPKTLLKGASKGNRNSSEMSSDKNVSSPAQNSIKGFKYMLQFISVEYLFSF